MGQLGWTFDPSDPVYEEGRRERGARECPGFPAGKYATVVVDPPWPMWCTNSGMEKVHETAHNKLKYKGMALSEIASLPVPELYADDTFVYLWAIQKHLPAAMEILRGWAAEYRYTMVWIKDGGYQAWGQPQNNCEFVVVGRYGRPKLLDTKRSKMVFYAPRTGHSRKPDAFYDFLRRVSPGPRIDLFARREIEGFDGWGDEYPGKHG